MNRLFTKDATGVDPNGRWYAGDINAIQDAVAALTDFAQTHSVGTLAIGDGTIQLLKFGTAEARLSAALRTDGLVRALGGLFAGTFTTAQRDAIPGGQTPQQRPFGVVILNTTTNRLEWNAGTDASPSWQPVGANGSGVVSVSALQILGVALASTHLSDSAALARLASPVFSGVPTVPTPAIGDNSLQAANTQFVRQIVPPGLGPLPYAGSAAPTGWLLCDGSAVSRSTYAALYAALGGAASPWGQGDGSTTFNVPDMRGRVPVGKAASGTFLNLAATGGEETHVLTQGEMPAHVHTISSDSAGTPAGSLSTTALTTNAETTDHTHTGTTDSSGAHTHTLNTFSGTANGTVASGGVSVDSPLTIPSAGAHTHTFTTGGRSASHTHTITAHGHTFTGSALAGHTHTIGSTGGGTAHNNLQPYAVVNYIIKH